MWFTLAARFLIGTVYFFRIMKKKGTLPVSSNREVTVFRHHKTAGQGHQGH